MIEAGALSRLRAIVAAFTAGDLDEVDRLVTEAGDWMSELEIDTPDETPAERPNADEHGALIALYNAAKRLMDQGSNRSTLAELEAAVKAAERFV